MTEILSLWRSPLDEVALIEAEALCSRQPQCSIPYDEDFHLLTVFNYGYYVSQTGATNDSALAAMFAAMAPNSYGNNGGTAFIPQVSYAVTAGYIGGSPPPFTPADQSNIIASGTGGQSGGNSFLHFPISPPTGATAASCFVYCNGTHTSGGIYFRSLAFKWKLTSYQDICIYADQWNVKAQECNFVDCPTAFYAAGLGCGLDQCTIQYTPSATTGPNDTVAVYLQGPECFLLGPGEFSQTSVASGGATGCTAIALGGGGGSGNLEHAIVNGPHISDWSYGLNYNINPGVLATHVSSVEAQCYVTCVNMQPPGDAGVIFGEKYTSCTLQKSQDSSDGHPIIYIDTNGGGNDNIQDIEFLNCTVYSDTATPQSSQYCYQITSGNNIRIIGGTASNAGGPTSGGAGVAITPPTGGGGPGRITILGVDLSAKYNNAHNVHAQQFALYISATPSDTITVEDCKMTGYSASPVYVTGTIGTGLLYITKCEGYNDQDTPINGGSAPITTGTDSAAKNGYYGPSLLTFYNSTPISVTVNGVAFSMSTGSFYLGPYDTILFASAPHTSSWTGE
jgi:hypothetical protein